jgi:fucose 4-O-acetylase-like acetyltransferase
MTNRLLFLNGLAIFMIAVQHASEYGLQAMFVWANAAQSQAIAVPDNMLPYYITMVIRQITALAVPAFLFISGYFVAFLARGKEAKLTLKMVMPRIKTLIPPFIVWTIIRYILLRRLPTSVDEILDPYHFVPLLIQFYLLSPLLVPAAKKRPILLLAFFVALHLVIQGLRYLGNIGIEIAAANSVLAWMPRWTFIGQQPFWFPFGLVFGLHSRTIIPWLVKNRRLMVAGAILFAVLAIVELFNGIRMAEDGIVNPNFSSFSKTFFILFFILAAVVIDVPRNRVTKFFNDIGAQSLGMYLGNIPSIYVVSVLIYHLIPQLLHIQIIYQPLLVLVGLFIPLGLMDLVRRIPFSRPHYRTIFG